MNDDFREFVMARLGALSRTAYLLTGDHHAAEDLLQDALVVVAARWGRVAASDNPVAYVRRILYHELVSSWRRNKYRRAEVSSDRLPERADGPDHITTVDRRVVLKRALARLTPEGHEVRIDLTITDDFPTAQAIVIISAVKVSLRD